MKILIITSAIITAISASAFAGDQYVRGYTKSDGTYVEPYHRSEANETRTDNYSTKGNTNPYTGQQGTKDAYDSGSSNSYGNGNAYGH